MKNIVVIASSDERTKKLLKHASVIAKRTCSKIWLIYVINTEKAEKVSDINNRIDSINNNRHSVTVKKSHTNNQATFHLDELKRNGIIAEPLYIERLNIKGFLGKVLMNQSFPDKPDLIS
jgi:predicted nuclease of restriction endonuclease-like (RecB) superfamily